MTKLYEINDHVTNLKKLKDIFQLECFVETGLYLGEGLDYVNDFGFKRILSCDLDRDMVIQYGRSILNKLCTNKTRSEYLDSENPITEIEIKDTETCYNLFVSDSILYLKNILDYIQDKNCMFWLDAHCPDWYKKIKTVEDIMLTETKDNRFPLLEEIKYLKENLSTFDKSIFILDDLHMLPDNPVGYYKPHDVDYGGYFKVTEVSYFDILKQFTNHLYVHNGNAHVFYPIGKYHAN